MDARARVSAVRAKLRDSGADAFLVTNPANVVYVTGFDGVFDSEDAHVAVVTADALTLYTDSRYHETAKAAAHGSEWHVNLARQDLYVSVCDDLTGGDVETLALESSVPYGRFRFISQRWGGKVIGLDECVERVRQVKDEREIARIEAAQELTDRAYDHILELIKPGMSEREIGLELEVFMRREGSQGVAFPPIVASGPNSAFPHASVTTREVQSGEFLKMDFGAVVDGYCADMTRTVVVGLATQKHKDVYCAVLEANRAGIAAVKPGVSGQVVDRAARAVIEAKGYGELFGHGLGHGVGLRVHELPGVGPRATDSLTERNVITIEPGVYMPGFGGVRIEDLVVVEAGGARVLTRSPKELIEL